MNKKAKIILWDFDGVILDSMSVRDWGFRQIFKHYAEEQVSQLIAYHRTNGGLSRYVKIRYFYEELLGKSITEDKVFQYAEAFSTLMKQELIRPENLINDALMFIKENFKNYNFHIVSGSDENELRFLCKALEIDSYFISIHGSPTPKTELVNNLLKQYDYKKENTCLIGDSFNDYEAATANNISFYGYNNEKLKEIGKDYIEHFKQFKNNS